MASERFRMLPITNEDLPSHREPTEWQLMGAIAVAGKRGISISDLTKEIGGSAENIGKMLDDLTERQMIMVVPGTEQHAVALRRWKRPEPVRSVVSVNLPRP